MCLRESFDARKVSVRVKQGQPETKSVSVRWAHRDGQDSHRQPYSEHKQTDRQTDRQTRNKPRQSNESENRPSAKKISFDWTIIVRADKKNHRTTLSIYPWTMKK